MATPRFVLAKPEVAPVRVHTESAGQGLSVWLGIDGDAATVAHRAAEILDEIVRFAQETGHELSNVTCNGRRLYERAAQRPVLNSTKESP